MGRELRSCADRLQHPCPMSPAEGPSPAAPGPDGRRRSSRSTWVAPASRRRLADPARLVAEVVLFAAGVVVLAAVGYVLVAVVFAVVVAANVILVRMLE
jgi:Protein of unknown function (DUF2568)